jgi:hypothetical protein
MRRISLDEKVANLVQIGWVKPVDFRPPDMVDFCSFLKTVGKTQSNTGQLRPPESCASQIEFLPYELVANSRRKEVASSRKNNVPGQT